MQEQKDEGSKEAPKAVPYVLCYTTPALPKTPVQAGSHHCSAWLYWSLALSGRGSARQGEESPV